MTPEFWEGLRNVLEFVALVGLPALGVGGGIAWKRAVDKGEPIFGMASGKVVKYLEEKLDDLDNKHEAMVLENQGLRGRVRDLEKQVKDDTHKIATYEGQIDLLVRQIKDEREDWQKERDHYRDQLQDMTSLRERVERLSDEVRDRKTLETKLEAATEQLESCRGKVRDLESDMRAVANRNDEVERQLTSLSQENARLNEENERLRKVPEVENAKQ